MGASSCRVLAANLFATSLTQSLQIEQVLGPSGRFLHRLLENRQQGLAVKRQQLGQTLSVFARSRPRRASRVSSKLSVIACSTRRPGVPSSNSRLAAATSALPSGVQFPLNFDSPDMCRFYFASSPAHSFTPRGL